MRMAIMIASAIASLAAMSAHAQEVYQTPRTSLGQPDLQGVWTNATITPLTRPAKYGERNVLTPDEARALEHEKDRVDRGDLAIDRVGRNRHGRNVSDLDGVPTGWCRHRTS